MQKGKAVKRLESHGLLLKVKSGKGGDLSRKEGCGKTLVCRKNHRERRKKSSKKKVTCLVQGKKGHKHISAREKIKKACGIKLGKLRKEEGVG